MTASPTTEVAFTPAVKAQQARRGSREAYARVEAKGGWSDRVTPELAAFLAARDSVYLGTASADGRPYIQHRGGPRGFLKVLDARTLAFADLAGNRQYITLGNLSENDRAFVFAMDYGNRRRIKLWGRARVVDDDPELLRRVSEADATAERAIVFEIEAWDVNCPKHITRRFAEDEVAAAAAALQARVRALEAELGELRLRLAQVVRSR